MEERDLRVCLVGGTGRSGTTILKKVFGRHPAAIAVPESRFLIDPDGILDFYQGVTAGWSPYWFDVKLRRLARVLDDVAERPPHVRVLGRVVRNALRRRRTPRQITPRYAGIRFSSVCPEFPALAERLIDRLAASRYRAEWTGGRWLQSNAMAYRSPGSDDAIRDLLGEFCRGVIRSTLEHHGATAYVEDNTWTILWLDRILELVPAAKLVHIHRDPRDVVSSYRHQRWAPEDPVDGARLYSDLMTRWIEVRSAVPEGSYHEVALEDLVADPNGELRRICEFWGLDWSDALLSVPLNRANTGRWRRDLSSDEVERVDRVLGEWPERLGYDR